MVQLVRWLRLRNARSETASVQRVRRQPWASAVGSTPETALSSSLSCEEGRVEYECDYQMRSRLDRHPCFGRLRRHGIRRCGDVVRIGQQLSARQIGRAHDELQSLMRTSYAGF